MIVLSNVMTALFLSESWKRSALHLGVARHRDPLSLSLLRSNSTPPPTLSSSLVQLNRYIFRQGESSSLSLPFSSLSFSLSLSLTLSLSLFLYPLYERWIDSAWHYGTAFIRRASALTRPFRKLFTSRAQCKRAHTHVQSHIYVTHIHAHG